MIAISDATAKRIVRLLSAINDEGTTYWQRAENSRKAAKTIKYLNKKLKK